MSVRSCPPCGPISNDMALRSWLERLNLQEVTSTDHDHAVRSCAAILHPSGVVNRPRLLDGPTTPSGGLETPVRPPEEDSLVPSEDEAVAKDNGRHDVELSQALVILDRAACLITEYNSDRILPLI